VEPLPPVAKALPFSRRRIWPPALHFSIDRNVHDARHEHVASAEDEPRERERKRGWSCAHDEYSEREEDECSAPEDRHDSRCNTIPPLVNLDEQRTGLSAAQWSFSEPSAEMDAHAQSGEKESDELDYFDDHDSPAVTAAQRVAAKLRPRVILPRCMSSMAARAAETRGRQLQRLVGRHAPSLRRRRKSIRRNEATVLVEVEL
jgi:hypothetical protein